MKNKIYLLLLSCVLASCSKELVNNYHIVPYPNHVTTTQTGEFAFSGNCKLLVSSSLDNASKKVAQQFANDLQVASTISLTVAELKKESLPEHFIAFVNEPSLGHEAYSMVILPNKVTIKASTAAGFFYAVQSMKQLLPLSIFTKKSLGNDKWTLPCINIEDAPRFQYRGMLLDVGRHFSRLMR